MKQRQKKYPMKEEVSAIMGISNASYYRWKENRKVIGLLEQYFTKEELREYMTTDKIERLEVTESENYQKYKEKEREFYLRNAWFKIDTFVLTNNSTSDLDIKLTSLAKAVRNEHIYTLMQMIDTLSTLEIEAVFSNKDLTIERVLFHKEKVQIERGGDYSNSPLLETS